MDVAVPEHKIAVAAPVVVWSPLYTPTLTRDPPGTAPVACRVPMIVALLPHTNALHDNWLDTVAFGMAAVATIAVFDARVPASNMPVMFAVAAVKGPATNASPVKFRCPVTQAFVDIPPVVQCKLVH